MKNRAIRLALAGGFALVATAPLTSSAHAMRCAEGFEFICHTYGQVCALVPEGGKYDVKPLLCESLA